MTLFRFTQALAWAVKGRDDLDSGLPCPAAFLPGCEEELLQETKADTLRTALAEILEQPSCPPTPEAMCRCHLFRASTVIHRAATVVGIPTNGRYTDHFQDSVFLPRCCYENNTY